MSKDYPRKNELNFFLNFLLLLSIIKNLYNIFVGIITSVYDVTVGISTIVVSVLAIILSVGILKKKKEALYAFYVLSVIDILIVIIIGANDMEYNVMKEIMMMILWSLAFCLRKNGRTAWSTILHPYKENNDDVSYGYGKEDVIVNIKKEAVEKSILDTTIETATYTNENEQNKKGIEKTDSLVVIEEIKLDAKDVKKSNCCAIKEKVSNVKSILGKIKFKKFFLLFVFVCILCCIWWGYKIYYPKYQYEKALSLLKSKDYEKSAKILEQLAENNYLPALNKYGILLLHGDTLKRDLPKSVKYLKQASNYNSSDAWYYLGQYYVCVSNIKQAMSCYVKAMKLGNQNAFLGIGWIYFQQDKMDLAVKYGKMVDDTLPGKFSLLGAAYFEGKHYNKYELAYYNYKKGVELGDINCMDNLGSMYYDGWGIPVNKNKAYQLFKRAYSLNHNDAYALYYLGKYEKEENNNIVKAIQYFTKAASLGEESAQIELSELEMEYPYDE